MQAFLPSSEPLFKMCCDIGISMFNGTSRWRELIKSQVLLDLSDAELETCLQAGSIPHIRAQALVFFILSAATMRRHLERHGSEKLEVLMERFLAVEDAVGVAHSQASNMEDREAQMAMLY